MSGYFNKYIDFISVVVLISYFFVEFLQVLTFFLSKISLKFLTVNFVIFILIKQNCMLKRNKFNFKMLPEK